MRIHRSAAAVLAVTVAAGLAAAAPASAGTPAGDDVRITVMETSDLHGNPATANRRTSSAAHRLTAGRTLTGVQPLPDAGRLRCSSQAC